MDRLESGRNRILDAQTHVPRTAKIHGNSFSAPPIHQGVSFIKGCPLNGPSVEQSRKASRGLSLQIVSLHPKNANIPADEKPFQIDHQPNTSRRVRNRACRRINMLKEMTTLSVFRGLLFRKKMFPKKVIFLGFCNPYSTNFGPFLPCHFHWSLCM